jgi:hypothetical protein
MAVSIAIPPNLLLEALPPFWAICLLSRHPSGVPDARPGAILALDQRLVEFAEKSIRDALSECDEYLGIN